MNIEKKLFSLIQTVDIEDEQLMSVILENDPELLAWWNQNKELDQELRIKQEQEITDTLQLNLKLSENERQQLGL